MLRETTGNLLDRIVALEKVAGSSPVGHPLFELDTSAKQKFKRHC